MLLSLGLALTGPASALVYDGKLDKNEAVATEQTIQVVRDLQLAHPVEFAVERPDEVAKMLAAPGAGQASDEEIAAQGAAGGMLGLFPKEIDLKSASVEALKSQLIAFYDFRSKEMVVIDGSAIAGPEAMLEQSGERDYLGYLILAHELTHALQDQNFALGAHLTAIHENSDRALALRALAEGDATLAGWGYVTGKMNASTATVADAHLNDAEKTFAAHARDGALAAYEYFNFPYNEGLRFVGEAYRRGGWAAVDALYQNPPTSTQQIIDPSLYFDHPTPPTEITLDGYSHLDGWTVAERDVWGELGLRVILQRNFGMTAPVVALAQQWGGDRLVVLRKGSAYAALWMVDFRDRESACRFAAEYDAMLRHILARRVPHLVQRRAQVVLIVAGPPALDPRLAPAIWQSSIIREP